MEISVFNWEKDPANKTGYTLKRSSDRGEAFPAVGAAEVKTKRGLKGSAFILEKEFILYPAFLSNGIWIAQTAFNDSRRNFLRWEILTDDVGEGVLKAGKKVLYKWVISNYWGAELMLTTADNDVVGWLKAEKFSASKGTEIAIRTEYANSGHASLILLCGLIAMVAIPGDMMPVYAIKSREDA